MNSNNCKSSLIIITRAITPDRAILLENCLRQITLQSRLPDEVLIVDNSSDDQAGITVAKFEGLLPIRMIQERTPGRGRARNAGLRAVDSELILFTDDDCIVGQDWVKSHLAAHEKFKELAIGGPLVHSDGKFIWRAIQMMSDDYLRKGLVGAKRPDPRWIDYLLNAGLSLNEVSLSRNLLTANISYKSALFDQFGGFDPNMMTGEEYEFHNRVFERDQRLFRFIPDIQVRHTDPPAVSDVVKKYRDYGYYDFMGTQKTTPWRLPTKMMLTLGNYLSLSSRTLLRDPAAVLGLTLITAGLLSGNLDAFRKLRKAS